jgi:S-DNA-T family DNA segregation ATPase FtsK/SpoIIIE
VDFKGGASFEALRDLPHCVGLITDLDSREALRALVSLSAEVRHRERLLAARAVRSIDDVPEGALFPRLVIVVDEYAAIVEEHPDLHALFTDLAARGRSLGIHLVLCTQRPAGVVRDSILANCGLRLSLRVNNRADSSAVIGSDDAAALPALPRGRALVSAAGEAPRLFQVARSSRRDVAAVAEAWAGVPRPRRPWCEPLPSRVTFADLNGLADLEGGGYLEDGLDLDDDDDGVRVRGRGRGRAEDAGVPFALADLPEEQRHAVARYRPHTHGHLLVVGAAGAGKSGVLAALMAAPSGVVTERVAGQLAVVWDVVAEPLGVGREPRLLLFDDIDAVIQAAPEEYMMAVLDQFARLLREGPAYGVHVVITAQRIGGPLHQLTALCGSTLVLRMPNRQEHLLAGGETGDWSRDLPPGAGTWRGNRIQVIQAARVSAGAGPLTSGCATDGIGLHRTVDPSQPVPGAPPIVIVSTRPARMSRRMRAANPSLAVVDIGGTATDPRELIVTRGAARPVLIGDPESWQSHWGALGALKATSDILFDAVSTGDFRLLTGLRELPPPPPRGERPLWLLSPDGIVSRARLAGPLSTQAGTAGAD